LPFLVAPRPLKGSHGCIIPSPGAQVGVSTKGRKGVALAGAAEEIARKAAGVRREKAASKGAEKRCSVFI